MFCGECGTKNEKGAKFCEKCGAKLEQPATKKVVTEKQPMSKKKKTTLIVVGIVAVIVVGLCIFLSNLTNPKTMAEKYFNAVVNHDADAVYDFLDVEQSEFTSKEMFKQIMTSGDSTKPEVLNYTVGNPVIAPDGMSASVTITYMLKDESSSDTVDVKFVKTKDKKWLFFDNWKVNMNNFQVVKDYQIKVMKGSTVEVQGIQLSSSYLDTENSSEAMDVYKMPAMFEEEYNMKVTLPIGITIEDDIYPRSNRTYTFDLSLSDLSDEVKTKLTDLAKSSLQTLYDGVKDGKTFADIKSKFEYTNVDLSVLEKDYESLVKGVGTSTKLTSITYKDVTLSSIDVDSKGRLELYVKATYDYTVSFESGSETKTNSSSDYDYAYLTYAFQDGAYHLVDTSSLNTYFSRYY